MEDVMIQLLIVATAISPIVTAGVQLLKRSFNLPKNYLPLIALVVGVGIGALAYISFPVLETPLAHLLWAGGLSGLASVGLFEITKRHDGGTKEPPTLQ